MGPSEKKFRVGDQLDVPVEIVEVDLAKVHGRQYKVAVRGEPDQTAWVCGASLSASRLVRSAPREIRVGDRVTWGTGLEAYWVVHIHQGWAWVHHAIYSPSIIKMDQLRHAD